MDAAQSDSCCCFRCRRYLVLPAHYAENALSGTLSESPVGDVMGWFICKECSSRFAHTTNEPRRKPMELPFCPSCRCVMDRDRNPIRRMNESDELESVELSAFAFCVECEPIPAN